MRLFCKYKVGDKVLIRYQNKAEVGVIERDRNFVGRKKIVIEETDKIYAGPTQLSYTVYKKNIIKRLK
jgi:hypothetical protein